MKLKITLLFTLTLALAGYGLAQDKTDKTDPAAGATASAADKADAAEKDDLGFPHDGKIDDVSAIGNRNVGCNKGLGNWYSLERQVRWARALRCRWSRAQSW